MMKKATLLLCTLYLAISASAQLIEPPLEVRAADFLPYDYFGRVDLSNTRLAVGVPFKGQDEMRSSELIPRYGAAFIFDKNEEGWLQTARLEASDRIPFNRFGWSVAVSGNHLLVTAPLEGEDENGENTMLSPGAAYLFQRGDKGMWAETQKIVASDRTARDDFGSSAAMDGQYALVGARRQDFDQHGENYMAEAGAAYFFKRNQDGVWEEQAKVVASDRSHYDDFGGTVDISGARAIIGAYGEDNIPPTGDPENADFTKIGAAYIFERSTDDEWTEVQKIVGSDRESADAFGKSVAIHGDYAVVGAPGKDWSGILINYKGVGTAYVYKRNEDGEWIEMQRLNASDREDEDAFGWSVAIHGDLIVVGAYGEGEAINQGAAYVFQRNEDESWTEIQKIIAPNGQSEDRFGEFVAIHQGQAAVAAPFANQPNAISAGAVYLYDYEVTTAVAAVPAGEQVIVSPNPVQEQLTIQLNSHWGELEVSVINALGQVVLSKRYTPQSGEVELNLARIPAGMYFIQLAAKGRKIITRSVVKK